MPNAVVQLDSISVAHATGPILDRFSLSVHRGERVLLQGSSGAGKTTLLRCILGFLRPHSGEIRLEGEPYDDTTVWRARQMMAYVAQTPDLGDGTAGDFLERPFHFRSNRPLQRSLDDREEWLRRVQLDVGCLGKAAADLSGGERQRIALVGAILLKRPILLLDEPTSALDPDARRAVHELLRSLTDTTMVMVAHDDAGLAALATRRVSLDGSPGGGTSPESKSPAGQARLDEQRTV